jgi:ferredoxin-NAD(P)+ reductase (naphthalene dioxygenase ferredoxin-specific)
MELTVLPTDHRIPIESGSNLLELLRKHGVPVSYSCLAGRCGTCRCRVTEGKVVESGRDVLSASVNDGQFVLACQTTLTGSCAIEIPEADEVVVHPAKLLKGVVTGIDALTHDIRRLRLRTNKPLSFSPGQYATLQFASGHIRPYSMANIEGDDELEFHVRLVPGGRASTYIAETLKEGDTVRVSGPLGTAYLRRLHKGPMLCVAGGTGLAPVLSIVRGALAADMDNPIRLYFGVRSPRDLYGADMLRDLATRHPGLDVHIVVSEDADGSGYRGGLVTDAVAQDLPDLTGWRAYVCGAPPMVEAAQILMRQRGLPLERIYADAFYATGI